MNLILFYAFARVLVIAALGVISVRNSVHATLLLVLCFFTTAALWLLMQAEFLAVAGAARAAVIALRHDNAMAGMGCRNRRIDDENAAVARLDVGNDARKKSGILAEH